MSMFPDCRTDDYYNEDFLDGTDKSFVKGYDWCGEQVVDNFFNNLDVYFDDDSHMMHILNEKLPEEMRSEEQVEFTFGDRGTETRKIETYGDLLRSKLQDWIESERDELITSMIESMDEDIYNAIRNKVLKENAKSEKPKEYYDSRKYAIRGVKECDGPEDQSDE